ncbi:MAG: hydrogenase expression/formation protein [Acidobacteriia bacterium]|nr:hydrogenase expression/formation protein [Methyloceanibacter sp.]MCL6492815.1 hydrogenase expression/formation protein [Terriglobia bacterium]
MTPEARSPAGSLRTGVAQAVLSEIALLLENLAATGQAGAIDLRSLPLTEADRAELEEHLGRGEVEARLAVVGASEVWETAYAGVWWIRHLGAEGEIASETIAVTRVPEILMTHPADVEAAAARLQELIMLRRESAIGEETGNG